MTVDHHDLGEEEFGQRIHTVLFPSSPIRSHEFLFGRDGQLDRIRRSMMAPGRQIFIYGERGVGKSSLASAAAVEVQSSDAEPLHTSCGSNSTFSAVIWNLIRATNTESAHLTTTQAKRGIEGRGFAYSTQTEVSAQPSSAPLDIEDAASRLDAAFSAYSKRTVAVVDEFDLIPDASERNKFGELVKALGDRKSSVKLIFTGVASSLDELLESHASAHRQLDTIQLERLDYQPRVDIINKAINAFELEVDPSVVYRIASVSNGFPYYVHLLTEHLLWTWHADTEAASINMGHLHKAFSQAADAVHADLRKPYDKAARGREHAAYILWAAADAFDLERTSDSIWSSYQQICDTLEIEPLEKKRFQLQQRNLRAESHGSILGGVSTRRLYFYREPMVRGYVRMAAACKNIELDDQHYLAPPQLTARAGRMSGRKRWMDTSRYVPNIRFGGS